MCLEIRFVSWRIRISSILLIKQNTRNSLSKKPVSASDTDRVPHVFWPQKQQRNGAGLVPLPPFGHLFQIHRYKLKLHLVANLIQASVLRIPHRVLLLRIRKHALYRLLLPLVQLPVLRRMPRSLRKLLVVLPDMPLRCLHAVLQMCDIVRVGQSAHILWSFLYSRQPSRLVVRQLSTWHSWQMTQS